MPAVSYTHLEVAQALIRTYFMERFLERVSVSEYRNNFILKGGMLVASIVGVDMRATMDIDTTVKALPLNEKDARAIIERIGELQLEDGVNFKICLLYTSQRLHMLRCRDGTDICQCKCPAFGCQTVVYDQQERDDGKTDHPENIRTGEEPFHV